MGLLKNAMIKAEQLGLCFGKGGFVCAACIGDPAFADFIRENADEFRCGYCGSSADLPIACSLGDVAEFMAEIIAEEWCSADNELPWDGREGGFQGDICSGSELLETIGFEPDHERVFNDLVSHFEQRAWCRRNYFAATPSERHEFGWQDFCAEVKHARRYTFWSSFDRKRSENDPDYLPPSRMLAELESIVIEGQLVRELPGGKRFWRAREHGVAEVLPMPSDFTAPPVQFATQPNRMSPAGIPMFYGADEFDTAVLEVAGHDIKADRAVTGVVFETLRNMRLLDLTSPLKYTSYFAPNGRESAHRAKFIHFFGREVSKPIVRDGKQHIEYVPTQVFTEYVRYHMVSPDGLPVDGIRYLSSWNRRPCVVLFLDADDCLKSRQDRPQALDDRFISP